MNACGAVSADRRRVFWTTQPEGCGTALDACGNECAQPGLSLLSVAGGKTFANNDYVRGLALNMLLTQGRRPDNDCGYRPGARGGHWQDTFRDDGQSSGSLMLNVPQKASVRECLTLIQAYAEATLGKLVTLGVASSVTVQVDYVGAGNVNVAASIYGQGVEISKVGVTVARLQNGWVWK